MADFLSTGVPVASRLQVEVRSEAPFLPKVAFVTITLASLGGAIFTGRHLGVAGFGLAYRWLALWVAAIVLGFLAWRVIYLRWSEPDLDSDVVSALAGTAVSGSRRIERLLAVGLLVSAPAPLVMGYTAGTPLGWAVFALTLVMAALLARPASSRVIVLGLAVATQVAWAMASTGWNLAGGVRTLHLVAFGLWIGGAAWNLGVAIPAGIAHPVPDAVIAGARQLQRFRWVVRFALPTVILSGLVQSDAYRSLPAEWWLSFPGILIPTKVLLIVALVVIFITCPLYRQCSPVVGVCRVEDLDGEVAV